MTNCAIFLCKKRKATCAISMSFPLFQDLPSSIPLLMEKKLCGLAAETLDSGEKLFLAKTIIAFYYLKYV